jgi:hypothetical protein
MAVPDILPYFQLVAQIALVFGAIFAGYQFLLHRRERVDQGALEVLARLQDAAFRTAYAKVWTLPLDADPQMIRDDPGMEEAVDTVAMTFEVLGVMVHNRMVPLEVVDQAIGGFLRESWRRTRQYVLWKRGDVGSRRLAEWYQWLAEHLAVETRRSLGAYEAFKEWRP